MNNIHRAKRERANHSRGCSKISLAHDLHHGCLSCDDRCEDFQQTSSRM